MRLEERYRRLLRAFPAAWRREHGEELIGTLLEAAAPGRERVAPLDALDLLRCGLTLRWRGLLVGAGIADAGGRPRARALAGIAAAGGLVAVLAIGLVLGGIPVGFLATSLVVAAVPGTGVLYTVSSSIGGGGRQGLLAACGCTLGVLPHVAAAMLGLSGIMQVGAVVFEVVRYVGVAYLVLMGASLIRDRGDRLLGDADAAARPAATVLRRGVLVNLLNPKLTIFFFAFLPQFLGPSPTLLDGRLLVLGGIFMLTTFVVFTLYAYASAGLRARVLGAPVARRRLQRVLGALLIGLGVKLAVPTR